MPHLPIEADPLTIAYVAMGVESALLQIRADSKPYDLDQWNGEIGFVSEVVSHAALLDQLVEGRELSGVFPYEVAEPFGEQFALALYAGTAQPAEHYARKLIAEMEHSEITS